MNVVKGSPGLAPEVASQLADPQTCFLFLGFGFHRWYARVLLHVLQTYDHRIPSLAVEGPTFFDHQDSARTSLFFEQPLIEFRHHLWSDFSRGLRRRYESVAERPPTHELPHDAPKVFLCHDSRDREQVSDLEERLHQHGIDTWRDKQDLRGGDNWDRRIERVLKDQLHYVLILETPQMLERAESYVHKEISEALERQKHFDEGFRFVIPVTFKPCGGLERLNDFHRFDFASGRGVVELAEEIRSDWKRRHEKRGEIA